MADPTVLRPAVHIGTLDAAAADLARWIDVGAEEEGVPTRAGRSDGTDVVAAAHAAACASSFGIGVALSGDRIALHERHMPAARPVLEARLGGDARAVCRRFGSNAARLVVRLPLRLADEPTAAAASAGAMPDTDEAMEDRVRRVVAIVTRLLQERGTPP